MLNDNLAEAGLLVTTQLMTTWGRYSALLLILFRTTWTCGHKKYLLWVFHCLQMIWCHWGSWWALFVRYGICHECPKWCYKICCVSRFSQIIDILSCKVYTCSFQFEHIWKRAYQSSSSCNPPRKISKSS